MIKILALALLSAASLKLAWADDAYGQSCPTAHEAAAQTARVHKEYLRKLKAAAIASLVLEIQAQMKTFNYYAEEYVDADDLKEASAYFSRLGYDVRATALDGDPYMYVLRVSWEGK